MLRISVFISLLCSLASAQEFRLSGGAADYQVFQRNERNAADLKLAGTADGLQGKRIEARITQKGQPLKGFGWMPITTVSGATWTGELKNVPVGGPYAMELRAAGATSVVVRELLVGDLWILAGQSNMEGVGDLADLQPPDPRVHSFDMADQWLIAKDPLHELPTSVDRVHWRRNARNEPERLVGAAAGKFREERKKGAGLGLPFAVEMLRRTGVPVGLVPCAHGGTSMAQWDPALRDKGGDSLYGSTYRRFGAVGGAVKGVLWYQGESDANPTAADVFPQKFEQLVASFRRDFHNARLPFYYVQIGRHINTSNVPQWNAIQEMQRKAETSVPHSALVTAVDFPLDDGIHVSTQAHKRLGARLANVAIRDLFPDVRPKLEKGPRPLFAKYSATSGTFGIVRVRFSGVNGKLTSNGRLNGFTIHASSGEPLPLLFKAEFDAADPATVLLHLQGKVPERATLHYGYGKDPYCNLRDSADMAALVFGPMPLEQ